MKKFKSQISNLKRNKITFKSQNTVIILKVKFTNNNIKKNGKKKIHNKQAIKI